MNISKSVMVQHTQILLTTYTHTHRTWKKAKTNSNAAPFPCTCNHLISMQRHRHMHAYTDSLFMNKVIWMRGHGHVWGLNPSNRRRRERKRDAPSAWRWDHSEKAHEGHLKWWDMGASMWKRDTLITGEQQENDIASSFYGPPKKSI